MKNINNTKSDLLENNDLQVEKPVESREWWIDFLRVIIVLLLIPNHVACSFVENLYGAGINFTVWNETFVDGTAEYITFFDSWQMHILFLFAGFSLVLSLRKRTFKSFVLERLKKLGIPLLFGYLFWIALGEYFGVLYVFKVIPDAAPYIYQVNSSPTASEFYIWWWWGAGMINPGHLWFLVILFLFYAWAAGGVFGVLRDKKAEAQNQNPTSEVNTRLTSEIQPENTALEGEKVPPIKQRNGKIALQPGMILIYALLSSQADKLNAVTFLVLQWSQLLFFIFGIVFAFQLQHIAIIQKHYKWTLPVSIVSFTVFIILKSSGATGGYLLIFRSIGAWYLVYSLIGIASKKFNKPSLLIQYLSKSSMAIYILHLPIQFIVGYYLLPIPFNPILKILLLSLIIYALSFGLYELIKRSKLKSLMLCFGINPPRIKTKSAENTQKKTTNS